MRTLNYRLGASAERTLTAEQVAVKEELKLAANALDELFALLRRYHRLRSTLINGIPHYSLEEFEVAWAEHQAEKGNCLQSLLARPMPEKPPRESAATSKTAKVAEPTNTDKFLSLVDEKSDPESGIWMTSTRTAYQAMGIDDRKFHNLSRKLESQGRLTVHRNGRHVIGFSIPG